MSQPGAKPRVQITEETAERLEIIELMRTPRPEKMARENALLEGASEVRYMERSFRPHHHATLEEIRKKVDHLRAPERAPLPQAPPLPPPPAPVVVPAPLSSEHEHAIARSDLVRTDTLYKTDTGEVVEAKFESGETATYVIEDGIARPVEDISKRVDELPPPAAPLPPPSPSPSPSPRAADEPKKRFGLPSFGKGKPAEKVEEPKEKKGFSFRSKKK